MRGTGWTTICMVREYIRGKMGENTMAHIIWIKNTDLVCTFGRMVVATKVNGLMADSTVRESTLVQTKR